jgi:hypothetical protein
MNGRFADLETVVVASKHGRKEARAGIAIDGSEWRLRVDLSRWLGTEGGQWS